MGVILDVWKNDGKPKEVLPPRQDVPTEVHFVKDRLRDKSSAFSDARYMARQVNQDLLAYLYRVLAVTVEGRDRVFWPLHQAQWAHAVVRSHSRPSAKELPLAPSVNELLDWLDSRDDFPLHSRELPTRDDVLGAIKPYREVGGLVLPRTALEAAIDSFFFDDQGRATDHCKLELPRSSYPFVTKSQHPETGKEGWIVAHTRCVKGSPYKWTSFVWFRDSLDDALGFAEQVLTLAEAADGGPYELPEARRARLPAFVDPLRLVLPFPDLQGYN